jgi:hypothetical protein
MFNITQIYIMTGRGGGGSAVSIATGYGPDGRGFGVRVPVVSRISSSHVLQAGSGASPSSFPLGTGDSSPGVKQPMLEADHSPPTSA